MKTRSEALLTFLAQRTMLSLWAYPNVFRPSTSPAVPAKEFADVIAVFGNDILIFSDKEIAFRNHTDPVLAWKRWYRSAVVESSKQLLGAKRYLLREDAALFEDQRCTKPLPLSLPPVESRRIHLIAIASGARDACIDTVGGDGFFMVTNQVGDPQDPQTFIMFQPEQNEVVHAFDQTAFSFLMYHIDTAPDLVRYLVEREAFFRRPTPFFYRGGECDLFLTFLGGSQEYGEPREFPNLNLPSGTTYFQQEGIWQQFEASDDYQVWQAESKKSIQWDEMIEHLIGDLKSGHLPNGDNSFQEIEEGVRTLAAVDRFSRRLLVDRVRSMGTDPRLAEPGMIRRAVSFEPGSSSALLLLCVNPEKGEDLDSFSRRIDDIGMVHACVLKLKRDEIQEVTLLAFRSEHSEEQRFIIGVYDLSDFNKDFRALGERGLADGIFSSGFTMPVETEFQKNPDIGLPDISPEQF